MARLNTKEVMAEFGYNTYDEFERQLKAGLPFHGRGKNKWFDKKECQEWFLHGWFDSLCESERRRHQKQFAKIKIAKEKGSQPATTDREPKA